LTGVGDLFLTGVGDLFLTGVGDLFFWGVFDLETDFLGLGFGFEACLTKQAPPLKSKPV
jgi:hypothetical protein